ncbi:hypothetical protein NDN08_003618 [Rhodosorus marinus]|uniref:Dynein regulatory complex protein 10 n=1 Tax=Rhodosorus marinus TaxID=101924 RepID=A0AAV8V302_9RHOD|nr:hypothetical protein NDN08_003618 [Rhodosorus marinus]
MLVDTDEVRCMLFPVALPSFEFELAFFLSGHVMEAFELLLKKFEAILEMIPATDRRSLSWRNLQEQYLQVKEAFDKICIVVAEWKSAPASTGALLKTIEAKVQTEIQAIESIAKAIMDMTEMTNVLVVKTDFSGHGADRGDEAGIVTPELTFVNPDAASKSQALRDMISQFADALRALDETLDMEGDRLMDLKSKKEGLEFRIKNERDTMSALNLIVDTERRNAEGLRVKGDKWKFDVAQRLGRLGEQVKSLKDTQAELLREQHEGEVETAMELKKNQTVIAIRDALWRRITYGEAAKKALSEEEILVQRLRNELEKLKKIVVDSGRPRLHSKARLASMQEVVAVYEKRIGIELRFVETAHEDLSHLRAHQKTLLLEKADLLKSIKFLKEITDERQKDVSLREDSMWKRFESARQLNRLSMYAKPRQFSRKKFSAVMTCQLTGANQSFVFFFGATAIVLRS